MSLAQSTPPTNEQPEVLDQRRHNFTQIDNEVFDLYAEHIGPQGIALYCALVRFAHQDRDAFPSHTNLGKKAGMSRRSVQKYLPVLTRENAELAKHNISPLVEIRERHREDGGQSSNLYVLLPVAKAAPPPAQKPAQPPAQTPAHEEYGDEEEGKHSIGTPTQNESDNAKEPVEFTEFYAAYPRKVAKADALKAWKSIRPSPELAQEIIEAIKIQTTTTYKDKEKRFIPYPASWLRAGQWDDEIEEPGTHDEPSPWWEFNDA